MKSPSVLSMSTGKTISCRGRQLVVLGVVHIGTPNQIKYSSIKLRGCMVNTPEVLRKVSLLFIGVGVLNYSVYKVNIYERRLMPRQLQIKPLITHFQTFVHSQYKLVGTQTTT